MRARFLWRVGIGALAWALSGSPAWAQFYEQHNLVSDGWVAADRTDPLLVNAWGLVAGPTTPWWVADNGSDSSTLYNGNTGAPIPLIVAVPGAPTGVVFNGNAAAFAVNGSVARFLFATEEGTIRAWNQPLGTASALVVDHAATGAIYKGLAIDPTEGHPRLYATNFHAGTVEVFDGTFTSVAGGFEDPTIPQGYAPFGIANLSGTIFVTYALQDEDGEDDVPGAGHGFVNAFDTDGRFLQRVASGNELNSPWGLAWAPDGFGKFSSHLLVGNFGDGAIHAYDPSKSRLHGEFKKAGPLHGTDGAPLHIDGLWAIAFGNGVAAGPATTLFFTAGPDGEAHGLFGSLTVGRPSEP